MASLIRNILILMLLLGVCGGCNFETIEKLVFQHKKYMSDSGLAVMDVSSKFIENDRSGKLFVVTGNVKNNHPDPRGKIRIRCKLYNERRVLAKQGSVYAGVIIGEEELKTGSIGKITKRLSAPQKLMGTAIYALPEQKLPFMVVFSKIPKDLDEFSFETPSSVKIDVANTGSSIDHSLKKITDKDVGPSSQE